MPEDFDLPHFQELTTKSFVEYDDFNEGKSVGNEEMIMKYAWVGYTDVEGGWVEFADMLKDEFTFSRLWC